MNVAVIGGTGTVGALVVDELVARGESVRILSRSAPFSPPAGVTHHRVDLTTGEGLDDAFAGVDAVVDASNDSRNARQVMVDGAARLLAAEAAAGVGHHVLISIVGIDAVPLGYYRAKIAQEATVTGGPVPWSIVRATQVHPLLEWLFDSAARLRLSPRSRGRVQPVHPAVVASHVADAAQDRPRGRRPDVAGPETRTLSEFARVYGSARGRRLVPVPLPMGPRLARALRAGRLTNQAAAETGPTFEQWLETRS